MEKRVLLAIVLSVSILLAWQAFFTPPASTPPAPAPTPGETPSTGPVGAPAGGGEVAVLGAMPRAGSGAGAAPAGPGVEVTTPLYRAAFGRDGTVTAWTLDYRGDKGLVVGRAPGPLAVAIARPGGEPEIVALVPDAERVTVSGERPTATVTFRGATGDGIRVEKVLRFTADTYRIPVEVRVEASAAQIAGVTLYWTSPVALPGARREDPWLTRGETADHRQLMGRILVGQNGRPEVLEAPEPALKDPKESPGGPELKNPHLVPVAVQGPERRWVALENDYFLAALALVPPADGRILRGRERDAAGVGVVFPEARLGPGQPWMGQVEVYVGPKEWDRLKALGVGLEQAQARNYGDFLYLPWIPMEWFCVPVLWLMNFLATQLPGRNYGVAIILLTVLVKIAFYPLTHKSMSSMKQMQALQPQLNALRSKFKSDPQRFQREQLELFRTHKVNPMGGCLPMVVQVPIFYALYLTLQYSVELRGAPFVLWIHDLSQKDPWYVLPILMGISMLIQQKMTPTVGNPQQAKIMLIMPVIFTFMFLEFPTGLVLYWLVNNVLSIAQQSLIDRAARGREAPRAVEAKGGREARRA